MGFKSFPSRGHRRGGTRHFAKTARQPQYKVSVEKYINKAEEIVIQSYTPKHTFGDFALLPELKNALVERKYQIPTAIQDQAIPHALQSHDIIGLANTGTGKTAAFVLPTLNKLKKMANGQIALIIAPTRELANQINDECFIFARAVGLKTTVCVGGMNIEKQKKNLRQNPHVIIGTPGRLKDLFSQRFLPLNKVGVVVLDEFDRLLDMGFLPDITYLLQQTPKNRQTLGFSATSNPQVVNLMQKIMIQPQIVQIQQNESSRHIEQEVIHATSKEHKIDLLQGLLQKTEYRKVLVFGRTKFGVQRLSDYLNKNGVLSSAIHGNKSQSQRQMALQAFKQDKINTLVATDVAARGLDIPAVTHVINFDEPENYEDYVHRIGRTGRAGQAGHAVTLIHRGN